MDDILVTIDTPECMPVRKHTGDAGADLVSMKDFDIHPGEKAKIPTGVKVAIPYRHVGLVFGRSGLATDKGLRPSNCVGVIDSGYRGEIFVPLHNDSKEVQHVARYERIAQLVIVPIALPGFLVVDKLPESSRGEGGFGSTGQR